MAQFATGIIIYGADVDGTVAASTPIFTAPQGFVISDIQVLLKSISGVAVVCTLSIGTNSTNFNNIRSVIALTGLTTANNMLNINPSSPVAIVNTGETVFAKVTIPSTATTYNLQVILEGYPV